MFFFNFYIRNGNLKKNYIKNGIFRNFLKSKFDPNIHQHTKLHHFKKFSRGGHAPEPP